MLSRRGAWVALTLSWGLGVWVTAPTRAAETMSIRDHALVGDRLVLTAEVPAGYGHAVLDGQSALGAAESTRYIAGGLDGAPALVTFSLPVSGANLFLRVEAGTDPSVPEALYGGTDYYSAESMGGQFTEAQLAGHVLNRLTYGPSTDALLAVDALGLSGYIRQQLDPGSIDESGNANLHSRERALFSEFQPRTDTRLVAVGQTWRYFKGSAAPPADWNGEGFDDDSWLQGPSGFGYGNDADHLTGLDDMRRLEAVGGEPGQPGYPSLFIRTEFFLNDLESVGDLILRIDYDDSFVAYLNGSEVARDNVSGSPPRYDATADENHEAGEPEDFELNRHRNLLRTGRNVLALEGHNLSLTSSDFSLIPELVSRRYLDEPALNRIEGVSALKQLLHVRGAYSERQLQVVLAEFWENHFTTDFDKVADYLEDLENSDGGQAMTRAQARAEAAQMEFSEYQFFFDNALGNFGDLLLYSATSPAQLIYLDNVLNLKRQPNENYAREILELFAFGVDNRYEQADIEELARCFTGWTVRKVWPSEKAAFPAASLAPPTDASVQFDDEVLLDTGPGWKYFKGTEEPAPSLRGRPTLDWAKSDFDDADWLDGRTSIGYGDRDDATRLSDMRGNYSSVYLRHEFQVDAAVEFEDLVLTVAYDDGYVAYLNGVEIGRSENMGVVGLVPAFDAVAGGNHEVTRAPGIHRLQPHRHLLKPAPEMNVLALQVHNVSLNSSDLSIHPRLVDRRLLPGSIENGNPNGIWTFRFDPEEHDIGDKLVFANTRYAMRLPANREGLEGLRDAVEVIAGMVDHPSTREFICVKLINKFVSDELTLETYHDGTAPAELSALLDQAMVAWQSTTPPGNIRAVLEAILDPDDQDGPFWSFETFRSKIKTPVEFVNSTLRALGTDFDPSDLPEYLEDLGMEFFTRDDPDGWSEYGRDWIDTAALLGRVRFAQRLTGNLEPELVWNLGDVLAEHQLDTAASIVDHYDRVLFQGTLTPLQKALVIEFVETNANGRRLALDPDRPDYLSRLQEMMGLLLSMPQWMYQ